MSKKIVHLRNILERLYTKYNRRELIKPDPLQFVYNYPDRSDMEIVAFLAAVLAYGKVRHIEKSLTNLLARVGDSPSEFVLNFDKKNRARLRDFRHRFTTGDDISDLLALLKKVLKQYGSIENVFVRGHNTGDKNVIPALSNFSDSLLDIYGKFRRRGVNRGLGYLLPSPAGGSACKRLNLFLRWMVRNDRVDPGLWKTIDKAKLIVPVDVHMGRLCRILGLHDQRTVSLSAAVNITKSFAEIEPDDPVKYDFALSRIGIVDNCSGRLRPECELCELLEICSRR